MAAYNFESRIPLDHLIALVKNLRSGEFQRGDNLILAASALGEIGALLRSGLVVSLDSEDVPATLDGCCSMLETMQADEISINAIPPWVIPIVLKIIELLLAQKRA